MPIKALVFLGPNLSAGPPCVRNLAAGQACIGLVEHSFWLIPNDKKAAPAKLEAASEIASRVLAFELAYNRDFRQMPALINTVRSLLQAISQG